MQINIIGAGIMGLCTAWALGRDGHQVTVYEQGIIPNPLGSSVDQHRLIRFPYGQELGYTRMVADAYRAWDVLWQDLGQSFYVQTGTLVLAQMGDNWAEDSATTLEKIGINVNWLDAQEIEARFPLLIAEGVESAFYLDSGGVLLADKIVEAIAHYLQQQGVIINTQTQIQAIEPEQARIKLQNGSTVIADMLIIAAGAWVTNLLPELQQFVKPSRQVVVYIQPPSNTANQWSTAPMILDIDPQSGFYLVPPVLRTKMKIGDHRFSLTGKPDQNRIPTSTEAAEIFQQCQQRLKNFENYHLENARTCFYTVEPKEQFIIEKLGKSWLMTGFSGHGFKFGALLGLAVAEAVAGKRQPEGIKIWARGN